MSNSSVCRLCLTCNVRMYMIIGTPLQKTYECLTNLSLESEGKPFLACYICYNLLKKCKMLTENALKAEEMLTQLLDSGIVITPASLSLIENQLSLTCLSITPPVHQINIFQDSLVEDFSEIIEEKNIFLKSEEEDKNRDDSPPDNHQPDPECCHAQSDSEDDVPLKNISTRERLKKKVKNVSHKHQRKNKNVGSISEYAREIILTKEEQLQELQERAKSINYINSPLKCELCFKGFVDTRAYDNHREKHDEKSGAHECDVCRMRYSSERKLRTHSATSHCRLYACLRCNHRAHTSNQAREHEQWHKGFTYECKLCGQHFRKSTSYLTHMRKHHPTQYVCNICGDSFVGGHGLMMHKSKTHHRTDKPPDNSSEPASERFCSECNIQFVTREAWNRHILSSARHARDNENDDNPQCRICSSQFPSSSELMAHLREHQRALSASRPAPLPASKTVSKLQCEECGAPFINRSKLQAHVRRVHLGLKYNKNIVCEVCGKKCTSNASLVYHQRTHTGEKPYPCGTCAKRFADNNQLRIHIRTHTGERPYCCAACGKRFSQKPALNRHYRVHTGAKPFICQYCTKTFTQSNSLKLHIRSVHLKIAANRKRNRDKNPQDVIDTIEDKELQENVSLQNL